MENQSSSQLREQRKMYDKRYGELVLGYNLLENLKDKMNDGKEYYAFVLNGSFKSLEKVDNNILERLGIEPLNFLDEIISLFKEEGEAECEIISQTIRGYIKKQGIEENKKEIIDGMNQTAKRVMIYDKSFYGDIFKQREIHQHDSLAMIKFGLEYIDKWKMYNNLFK